MLKHLEQRNDDGHTQMEIESGACNDWRKPAIALIDMFSETDGSKSSTESRPRSPTTSDIDFASFPMVFFVVRSLRTVIWMNRQK
jgi:hypothetical protein